MKVLENPKNRSQTFMLMLCAGEKKAINSIISILSCRDKVIADWGTKKQEVCLYGISKALDCGVQFKHERSKGGTKQYTTL